MFLTICGSVFGQAYGENERLLNVIRTAAHDSIKIKALCLLGGVEEDRTRGYKYLNEAFAVARKGKGAKGEAFCYRVLGDFIMAHTMLRRLRPS